MFKISVISLMIMKASSWLTVLGLGCRPNGLSLRIDDLYYLFAAGRCARVLAWNSGKLAYTE